jgi:sugar/nucleoside kinase (ribokinase family)
MHETDYTASGRILVIGDLTVDIHMEIPEAAPGKVHPGIDLTVVGWPRVGIGGTAYLFAKAIRSMSNYSAAVIGAIGDDPFGNAIMDEFQKSRLENTFIQKDTESPTPVLPLLGFDDGTRLMARPYREAMPALDSNTLHATLSAYSPESFKLMFISGYSIATPDLKALKTVHIAADWARSNSIPIIVDLVPHEFAELVGPLTRVTDLIGKPSGFVAELRTVRGLGLCGPYQSETDAAERLRSAAANLAETADFAIVQHQLKLSTYAQIYATPKYVSCIETYDFEPIDRTGLGDRLLVRTLLLHQVI